MTTTYNADGTTSRGWECEGCGGTDLPVNDDAMCAQCVAFDDEVDRNPTINTLSDLTHWLTLNLIDRMEVGFEVDRQYCWERAHGNDDDDTFVFLEQLGAITRALDIALDDVYQRRLAAIERACDMAMAVS